FAIRSHAGALHRLPVRKSQRDRVGGVVAVHEPEATVRSLRRGETGSLRSLRDRAEDREVSELAAIGGLHAAAEHPPEREVRVPRELAVGGRMERRLVATLVVLALVEAFADPRGRAQPHVTWTQVAELVAPFGIGDRCGQWERVIGIRLSPFE